MAQATYAEARARWPSVTLGDAKNGRRHGYMMKGHPGTTLIDAMYMAEGLDSAAVTRQPPEDAKPRPGAPAVWPAVQANSAGNSSRSGDRKDELLLQGMMRENVDAAFWATAKSTAAGPDFAKMDRSDTGLSLQTQMALQERGEARPRAAPRAGDWRSGSSQVGSSGLRSTGAMLPEQMSETAVGGPTTVGSDAMTGKPAGSPSPAFPCWLQGYSAEWLFCAPVGSSRRKKRK